MDEDQEYWQHSDCFAVICSAGHPNGKGGCGTTGGFQITKDAAIAAWNTRAPQQREPLTYEELYELLTLIDPEARRLPPGFLKLARVIEAAHSIGGKK